MLASVQVQEEDSIPPGLMRPLLGSPKTNEEALVAIQLFRLLNKCEYSVELFEDRVVGQCQGQVLFFLLENDLCFDYNASTQTVSFWNTQTSIKQAFVTENKNSFDELIAQLKMLCPQSNLEEKYELLEKIGEGKKSIVYCARHLQDSKLYAIKLQEHKSCLREEIGILRELEHPNLVYFREFFVEKGQMGIVMDYEDGGSLLQLIQAKQQFPNKQKIKLVTDMLNALEFLRIKGIVHRDLKPQNILFSRSDGNFKIGDFGFATKEKSKLSKAVGTPGYIAPEIFSKDQASIKSDIYSMGLIFFQAFTGKQFYEGESVDEILKKNRKGISRKKRINKGFEMNEIELQLLEKMIRLEPEKRKSSYDILKSKTFNKMNLAYGLEYSTTCSPSKNRSSGEDEEDGRFFCAVRKLLKMRSSSN